jgi:hypothetical protein
VGRRGRPGAMRRGEGRRCGGVGQHGEPGAARRGEGRRGGPGAERWGEGRRGMERVSGWRASADAKREKKQRTEKKEPDVFKYLIFGGQGAGRRK